MGVYAGYATLGFQGLYAAIFGLCIIALFGTWLMCCCGKDRCRFLLYCACFFMFFLVFFTTIFTVAFSAAIPPFAWGCDFITSAFADQPQFDCKIFPS